MSESNIRTAIRARFLAEFHPDVLPTTSEAIADGLAHVIYRAVATLLQTKGDLLTRSDTENVNLAVGSDGSLLVGDSTQTTGIKWATDEYRLKQIVSITASGTYTLPAGVRAIRVECVGGGGGGGGGSTGILESSWAGGGGGGAFAVRWISSPTASYTVTIGAGGGGGAAGNNGTAGSDTDFGTVPNARAKGGAGGTGMAAGALGAFALGGAGGSTSTSIGDIAVGGGPGMGGIRLSGRTGLSGNGGNGSGCLGGGGGLGRTNEGIGNAGTTYGGGGSGAGALNSGQTGGAGAAGLIRVWEYA